MAEPIEITQMKKNANNKEYVLEAVNKNGKLLEFASNELKNPTQ